MKSMTGFGRGKNESGNIKYAVEISSVNHKYFDVNYRMASQLIQFQERMKEILRKEIDRGRIDLAIFILEGYKNQRVARFFLKEYLLFQVYRQPTLRRQEQLKHFELDEIPAFLSLYY